MNSLTISIPAYNDGQSIHEVIIEAHKVASQYVSDFEILVIDDGSKDDTAAKVEALLPVYPNLRLIRQEKNMGFGYTLKRVFTLPDKEWILFIPGDNQFPARNLTRFIAYEKDYDYMLGYRHDRKDNFYRQLNSYIYNGLVSLLYGRWVKDVNSIFLLRREKLQGIELKGTSAFVHAELYINLLRKKARMVEVTVEHIHRKSGKGSGGKWHVVWPTFKDLLRYRFKS